jgi:Flp pilus assembly protein TadG
MAEVNRLPGFARSLARSIGAVLRDTDGVSLLEFGLASPLMIYTLFAAADIAHGLEISRRLTNTANTLAELSSQISTTTTITEGPTTKTINSPVGSMTDQELTLIVNSIMTTFPDVLADASSKSINWQSDIEAIVSEVVIGPSATCVITSSDTSSPPPPPVCNTANVLWSAGLKNSSSFTYTQRSCITPLTQATSNTANPTVATLPPGLYSPGSVIVVDVFYHYTPMFTKWLTGTLTFQRTAYMAPRYFYELSYTGAATSTTYNGCNFNGTLP